MTNTQAPTQAQIEAAAKAIGDLEPFEVYDCEKAAKAALTAAAQVGTFEAGPDECDTGVALTKAIDAVLAEDTPLVNHTIERCAQVVEATVINHWVAAPIAAAIRKLKEVDT